MKPYFLLLLSAFTLTACNSTQVAHSTAESIARCDKTLHDYIQLRDKGPVEHYQALFTRDATFSVPKLNIALSSSEQIAKRVENALKTKKSIHMLTSSQITPNTDNTLTSVAHFVLYLSDKNDQSKPTMLINGRYIDTLEDTQETCLIKERLVVVDRMDTMR